MFSGTLFNTLAILTIVLAAALYGGYRWKRKERNPYAGGRFQDRMTLDSLIEFVKETLHEMTHSQLSDLGLHEEEYRRRLNKRSELRRALKGCISGSVLDKRYVKDVLKELLVRHLKMNEEQLHSVIPFHQPELLTSQDKFEILMYMYQQSHGEEALSVMLEHYRLAEPRLLEGYGEDAVYAVIAEDIEYIYRLESPTLTYEEKLDITVQRIYQNYKGFSVIDEIRDQRIDGVSGGVSGMVGYDGVSGGWQGEGLEHWSRQGHGLATECKSVWIFYKGVSIHLAFLSFEHVRELKRVCQNIYKFNHPGQLSEASGYKVNEMKDGSRVVVVRPPFAESWAFFVRKFDTAALSLEQLIQGSNAGLPIGLIIYLMKGSRITAVTGAQGSGKTTLLMAMVRHIYASYTLRVQEMAFELHLRKMYSRRNILSFRETMHISGQEGLDLQKKTDGTVNILGEVASDEVASWMIQMSQVASLFTVFTHHAKTFKDLIQSLRNSLLKSGMFRQEDVAEEQVVSVINFDIHLKRDHDGSRYIERITECIPLEKLLKQESRIPVVAGAAAHDLTAFNESQSGERPINHPPGHSFVSRNVVEFRNGTYVASAPLSEHAVREMEEQMQPQDAAAFRQFILDSWGVTA